MDEAELEEDEEIDEDEEVEVIIFIASKIF